MNRRSRRLGLETLEARCLLSSLTYSLTTDHSTYQVSQPIQMTFTVTNTGDQPLTIPIDPTDFTIKQVQLLANNWESNPENANRPPTSELLEPGQSLTQTATWVPSSYAIYNTPGSSSFVVSNPNAPPGLTTSFQIADPIRETLTTDQTTYDVGEPVSMTFTMTNESTVPEQVPLNGYFGVVHDGQWVWDTDPVPPRTTGSAIIADPTVEWQVVSLQPGQSSTFTAIWDGLPNLVAPSILSGSFTVTNSADPEGASATFQIAAPDLADIATSVTTDKSVYTQDQISAIQMSFTVTNIGQQPIMVIDGSPFLVTENGIEVGTVSGDIPQFPAPTVPWELLQPGQSSTTTATGFPVGVWSTTGFAGMYLVSNSADLNPDSATFQIIDPSPSGAPATQDPAPKPALAASTPASTTPSAPLTIANSQSISAPTAPFIAANVFTNRLTVRPGQTVRMTMTFKETGALTKDLNSTTIALAPNRKADAFFVLDGSKVVWRSSQGVPALHDRAIRPGATIKIKAIWNGRPNQPGVKTLRPGTYTILADEDGFEATSTITIKRR